MRGYVLTIQDGSMTINGEFERMCENTVVACFGILLLKIVVSHTLMIKLK
jgi:hypothetical protein